MALDLSHTGPPVATRDAATVLALRDTDEGPQVFMVRRDSRLGFLGGAHVFPGGALDERDCETASTPLLTGVDGVGPLARIHADETRARGQLVAAAREAATGTTWTKRARAARASKLCVLCC